MHQNLLETIKKALNHELPATISIPHVDKSTDSDQPCKEIESNVDNCSDFLEKRYKMICQIQFFLKEGCSYREIAKRMEIGCNTIAKYREGDPKELSMYGIRQSKLDPFYDFIIQCLNSGWNKSKTVKALYEKGYSGSTSNAFDYLCKIEQKENKCFEPQPYVRTMTECLKYKTGSKEKEIDYITREGVFRHMWMNTELIDEHKKYIYDIYLNTGKLHCCIKEFRNIFKKRNVPLFYLFIEKYSKSPLKPLKSFAERLNRDIDAVENAVTYDYSNSFVEGTNSRLKMIKRTMYGRCGKQLLEAKLRYIRVEETDNCGRTPYTGQAMDFSPDYSVGEPK